MDLGFKYMSRIFIYSSVFLGCYVFYAILMLLQFFKLIKGIDFSDLFNVLALYDIIYTLGLIVAMLHFGASVNHQYVRDQLQLLRIK